VIGSLSLGQMTDPTVQSGVPFLSHIW
jgi:hypothetical protein